MPAALATEQFSEESLNDLLHPDQLVDGEVPEKRVVYGGISWERYLAIDRAFGDDRRDPRLFYWEGELEIVTTSNEHERILRIVSFFLDEHFEQEGIRTEPRGHATIRRKKIVGAEPDDAWCISPARKFPDIVLEVALSSGGIPKLKVYQQYSIPEVWLWKNNALRFYLLRSDRSGYDASPTSRFAPSLNVELLVECVGIKDWYDARKQIKRVLAR